MALSSFSLILQNFNSAIVRNPLVVAPDTPVQAAIALMAQGTVTHSAASQYATWRASCVWVVEDRQIVGQFTEQDVVRLSASPQPLTHLTVGQVSTPPPAAVSEYAFQDAATIFQRLQQSALGFTPVVDEEDQLVGMLTPASILSAIAVPGTGQVQTSIEHRPRGAEQGLDCQEVHDLVALEKILDGALVGYWDWDIVSDREYLSPGFKRIFGYADFELPNTHERWQSILFPEDLPKVIAKLEQHIHSRGRVPYEIEVRYRHKDGSTIWVMSSGQVIDWDEQGKPLRMVGCHVNITQRKETELALQKAKEELESFFLVSLDLLCIADAEGRFRRVNPSWEGVLGYAIAELEGESFLNWVHPDDLELTLAAIKTLTHRTIAQSFVNRFRCKDGSYRYIEWYAQPQGQLIYAAARDITQQHQLEIQLQKRETHLKTAQRIASMGSWEFDVSTEQVLWSDEVFTIFGRDPALGAPSYAELQRLFHPEDQPQHAAVVEQAIATQTPYDIECRIINPLKGLVHVQVRSECFVDATGNLIQLVGTILDITERKQTEEKLRKLSNRLSLALQAGAIGTWDWDVVSNQVSWDERMYDLYGVTDPETTAAYPLWLNSLHPADRETAIRIVEQAIKGELEYDNEFRIIRPDGTLRYIKAYAIIERNPQGAPLRMVGVDYDITRMKQAEQDLLQTAAQLAASNHELEAFAYSVSHDLRSPLRAINGFSQVLLEDYGEQIDSAGQNYIARICHNVQRMSNLIDDLLALSRVSRLAMKPAVVNLSALVDEQVAELRSLEPQRQVEVIVAPDVTVQADATLMGMVINNLIQNAWKFTSAQPQAHIEFGRTHIEGETVFFVRDNGAGFDMAYADMLFGVFQRLHSPQEFPGTGIGLATVQRVIHRHGGKVWAEAAIAQGATFFFTVPSAKANGSRYTL